MSGSNASHTFFSLRSLFARVCLTSDRQPSPSANTATVSLPATTDPLPNVSDSGRISFGAACRPAGR